MNEILKQYVDCKVIRGLAYRDTEDMTQYNILKAKCAELLDELGFGLYYRKKYENHSSHLIRTYYTDYLKQLEECGNSKALMRVIDVNDEMCSVYNQLMDDIDECVYNRKIIDEYDVEAIKRYVLMGDSIIDYSKLTMIK